MPIFRHWLGDRFLRSAALLASGTLVAQAVLLASAPVLTRLYAPSEFGLLGVYASIVAVLTIVASLRFEVAIPLASDDRTASGLLRLALLLALATALLTGVAIGALIAGFSDWGSLSELAAYAWLIPLSVLGAGVLQAFAQWGVRHRKFAGLAKAKVAQSFAQAVSQIAGGLAALGPLGLLLGHTIGQLVGGGLMAVLVSGRTHEDTPPAAETKTESLREIAARHRRFPMYLAPAGLLNSLGLQLPTLLLAALYGASVAGWFALGQRVLSAPMVLLGGAVAKVYLGEAGRLAREDPPGLMALFRKTLWRLGAVGVPVTALALAAPLFVEFIFGSDWGKTGVYVQILAPLILVRFVASPLAQTLSVVDRQDLQLAWDILRVVLVSASLVLPRLLDWSDLHAITAYGVTLMLAYVLLSVMCYGALVAWMRRRGAAAAGKAAAECSPGESRHI